MDSFSLTPSFSRSLECPICLDFYSPPILLCSNGHSICSVCVLHPNLCPVCQGVINRNTQNKALELVLKQVFLPCTFSGCTAKVDIFSRNEHFLSCIHNDHIACIECNKPQADLVAHLVNMHEYKEIIMELEGGLRSFSGPYDSWIRETEWPKGIWKFGQESLVVHAKSTAGIFHIYLSRISKFPMIISMMVESTEHSIEFEGEVPHLTELLEKPHQPHFNCEINILLRGFLKEYEEDEEILRLWVNVLNKK